MKEERCVKGATSTFRGHLIYWDGERWRYKDDDSIAAADKHGIVMVFTGKRHFKH